MKTTLRRVADHDWHFEHHPFSNPLDDEERTKWFTMGGPDHDPTRHAVSYSVPEKGKVNFHSGGMDEFDSMRRQHGDEAVETMRKEILRHHGADEVPPPPAPPKKAPPKVYYHGTHVPGVTHILPADHHGKPVLYDETDSRYAYATPSLDDAWDYATDAAAHAKDRGHPHTRPRVYAVSPIGGHKHVEVDPEYDEHGGWRGNNPDDKRSKKGFKVVKEMKAPPHVRKDHPDEDWSN